MAASERMKMAAGEWYTCIDDELEDLRVTARDAVFEHNSLPPRQRGNIAPALRSLLGDGAFLNAGCTILDTAPVRIGEGTLLGPNVQIYCAEHHREATGRLAGWRSQNR
jgi:maltose O-acetyltransferase